MCWIDMHVSKNADTISLGLQGLGLVFSPSTNVDHQCQLIYSWILSMFVPQYHVSYPKTGAVAAMLGKIELSSVGFS
jgi:hypothetical protein